MISIEQRLQSRPKHRPRTAVLLAADFAPEEEAQLRALISRHITQCVNEEWHAMAEHRATYVTTGRAD